ncbi:hypothetical protein GCM10023063_49140 [Arthrobacter methylotrophus]
MQYISTRGGTLGSYSDVLLEGLAPNGGLAVPELLPRFTNEDLESWRSLDYAGLATAVLGLFATDIPREDLEQLTAHAYGEGRFVSEDVVPLQKLDAQLTLVGLSEGPTLAFKDMAMQYLGQTLDYVLGKRDRVLNVLGATSGDTGSAAEHALRGRERVSVFMLSPQGRMSAFQRAQMYSLQDENVHNIAVKGVFDDCQNLVKRLAEGHRLQARQQHRRRQLHQLRPHLGPDRLLRVGVAACDRRTVGGCARRLFEVSFASRPATSATSSRPVREVHGPARAQACPRGQREQRPRRVLPHGLLPPAQR